MIFLKNHLHKHWKNLLGICRTHCCTWEFSFMNFLVSEPYLCFLFQGSIFSRILIHLRNYNCTKEPQKFGKSRHNFRETPNSPNHAECESTKCPPGRICPTRVSLRNAQQLWTGSVGTTLFQRILFLGASEDSQRRQAVTSPFIRHVMDRRRDVTIRHC